MQLETALSQLPTMNELKKKVMYQLGLCAEDAGDDEKAPSLIKEPLEYEAIKVQTRNYKS